MTRIMLITLLSIVMIGCSGQQSKTIIIDAPSNNTNINVTITPNPEGTRKPPPPGTNPPLPSPDNTLNITGIVDRVEQFLSPYASIQEGDAILYLKELAPTNSEYRMSVGILLRRCSPLFILAGKAESGDKMNINLGGHDVLNYNSVSILVPDQRKVGTHTISLVGRAMESRESLEFACGTRKYFVQKGEEE